MILYIILIVALVFIDQLLKHFAEAALSTVNSLNFIPGILEFKLIYNDGAAFSLFAGKQQFLILFTAVVIIGLMVYLIRSNTISYLEKIACSLIISGGIGNLIDRAINGRVVDYIHTLFMEFPVFNFADICVCLGVAIYIISLFLFPDNKK